MRPEAMTETPEYLPAPAALSLPEPGNAPLALPAEPAPLRVERLPSDTAASFAALSDYCAMGPRRSLSGLHARYTAAIEDGQARGDVGARKAVPTPHLSTLETWSAKHGWSARAAIYDEALCACQRAASEAFLTAGLSLPGERVRLLTALVARLLDEHGSGLLLSVERNESGLLSQLRGLLDDIAKETGGRTLRADVTSKGEAIGQHTIIVAGHEITF